MAWLENQAGLIIQIKEIKMSKKILLITSVIFLSSCAATNIQELGDKFLDLINPSDAPTEVIDLSEAEILLTDESIGFTEEELEMLSNDELIEIAKEKGMEDTLILDADGNLQNRDEVIKALTDNLIILDEDGNIQNKDEVIEALREGAEETKLAALLLENAGITSTLYFSYDDSEIDEVATRIIIQHANFMQSNPSFNLRLEGHADERGTREYNLALGENRALNVKEVLGLYNLEDRIVVVSYGEEQPILTGSNEEAWEKNRRVEFSYY